jgi:non-ribosomal peptide synthetase component E (peptide arylation enzyme)
MGRSAKVLVDLAFVVGVARQQDAIAAEEVDGSLLAKAQVLEALIDRVQDNRSHSHSGEGAIGIGKASADPDAEIAVRSFTAVGAAHMEPKVVTLLMDLEVLAVGDVERT